LVHPIVKIIAREKKSLEEKSAEVVEILPLKGYRYRAGIRGKNKNKNKS
jgi:hypothetical protein